MSTAAFRAVGRLVWTRSGTLLVGSALAYAALLIGGSDWLALANPGVRRGVLSLLNLAPFLLPAALFVGTVSAFAIDLSGTKSYFPAQFFTLPLTARQMVLPFLVGATALSALLWLLGAIIVGERILLSRSGGLPVPWLPCLTASLLAWMQVMVWLSFSRRQVRLWMSVGLAVVHATWFGLLAGEVVSEMTVAIASIMQVAVAYRMATWGVARARRGDPDQPVPRSPAVDARQEPPDAEDTRTTSRAWPFRSRKPMPALPDSRAAQAWFEWRAHRARNTSAALVVPFGLAAILLLGLVGQMSADDSSMRLIRAAILLLAIAGACLTLIGFVSGVTAASYRSNIGWMKANAFAMPAFFATLPLSTGDFAWAKLKATARSMALLALLVAVLVAGFSVLFSAEEPWVALFAALSRRFGALSAVLLMTGASLAVALFAMASACNVVWIALFGRDRILGAVTIGGSLLLVAAPSMVPAHLQGAAGEPALLREALPWLAGAKLLALAWLSYRVWAKGHYTFSRIVIIDGLWLAAVAAVTAFVAWVAPVGLLEPGTLIFTVVAATPVLGILAAPLALQYNRVR